MRIGEAPHLLADQSGAPIGPIAVAEHQLRVTDEIGDLPLYDPDLEGSDAAAPWSRFRAEIAAADAVLFVTPE